MFWHQGVGTLRPRYRHQRGTHEHLNHDHRSRALQPRQRRHSRLAHVVRARRLWVSVADSKEGGEFSIDVRDRSLAMDVFHHPFGYAARYGVDTGLASEQSISELSRAAGGATT